MTKKPRGKAKKTAEARSTEDEEDDAIIRCICGLEDDDDGGRTMIQCDNCQAWQHNDCMGVTEEEDQLPEHYFCEICKPEDHEALLAALSRGEKPWREVARTREEKKSRKKKGGRRGRRQTLPSDPQSGNVTDKEANTDAQRSSSATQNPDAVQTVSFPSDLFFLISLLTQIHRSKYNHPSTQWNLQDLCRREKRGASQMPSLPTGPDPNDANRAMSMRVEMCVS